ncbi:DELLA protein GAI1 [Quillaja saponaria]|uniref:DELLA protein GAI1 n=1 Tax=Quillaja saponaria TaxID=32244 RepID=A0AAD7Q1E2_QUISA|nr:DELLA protein GAI1 [Quillaja saponaria]
MENALFSTTLFDFNGFQGGYSPLIEEEPAFESRKQHLSGMEFLGGVDPLSTENDKETDPFKDQQQDHQLLQQFLQQHEPKFDNLIQEELDFTHVLPSTQPVGETIRLNNVCSKQVLQSSSLTSLELLNNYGTGFKKLKGRKISNFGDDNKSVGRGKLSTEEIMRVAGSRYVQFSSQGDGDSPMTMHPYGCTLSDLSEEETRDVELAHFLLAAAERVGYQQFERARKLLVRCKWISSAHANAVHKVVFHFAEALRERIEKEVGHMACFTSMGPERNEENELIQGLNSGTALACHQLLPFNQILQFPGMQAIVENVAYATKIHVIDISIRSGVQFSVLMQAVAEWKEKPVELFKITAIGLIGDKKIEETGKRLASVAESLNLPFSYKVIFVADIIELKEDQFEIEQGEALAVYSPYILRTLISSPHSLENLMRILKNLKPSIMIVLEVEGNHNSPLFVNRFTETLFYYSAFFDSLETCFKQNNKCKSNVEAILSEGIRNIVAMEGSARTVRNVKLDVWRAFFARFRMVETPFSESSLYQANLVIKRFPYGNLCTLDKNGKSLQVGWKGTPLHSVSAWKFH